MKIGFIGLGNMAKAMIGGMLEKQVVTPEALIGSAASAKTIGEASQRFGMETTLDNCRVAAEADVLFLAVKPQMFPQVIAQVKDCVNEKTLVISIAAGKTTAYIEQEFGKTLRLARCMPNTPALVGEGCTGVCYHGNVTEQDKALTQTLLSSFGRAVEVPERLMDTVGAVAGSAPAYVCMFVEAMADAAVLGGMPRAQAYEFAAQTVLGTAKLILETGKHPAELKDMVCSPGGTTIEGVRVLESAGMRSAVVEALTACVEKSKRL
ncbi:MAG: pyrroline-5-carboxylate reductase [bacterium]|nr:pyrroline-5-carboxylate reductase [bacterium]